MKRVSLFIFLLGTPLLPSYKVVEVITMQEFILECFVDLMAQAAAIGYQDSILSILLEV